MTPRERSLPHVIDASRRRRIAAGSGTSVEEVNRLLEARKQMAKMMKQIGSGKVPALPGLDPSALGGPGMGGAPRPSATRKSKSKRKRKAKR
jgi:signal recognition particle subunit SRP54